MQFKEGKCPKCFGVLQIPSGRDEVICMYCGEKIRTAEAEKLIIADKEKENGQIQNSDTVTEDYQEILQFATDHISDLFYSVKSGFEDFKKNTYKDAFESYFRANYDVYVALEKIYLSDNQEKDMFHTLAKVFVGKIENDLKELKKRSKERKLIDCNLTMAVYVIPGVLHYGGAFADCFTDLLLQYWKEAFPATNLSKATFETVNSGFKTKLCYITTAVCESLGKSDDCYELHVLRSYRDSYLSKQPDGMEMIGQYYDIAPTIVNRVNKMSERKEIYSSIWNEYLKPCISLIEDDRNDECKQVYTDMVHHLQKKFVEDKNE